MILLHGFGCDGAFWAPQLAALQAAGHEVSAPDLPYHGGPVAGVAPSLQALAGWVLEASGGVPAVLAGHSMGGMIALQAARERPDLVSALVLVDAFPSLAVNASVLPGMFAPDTDLALRRWVERERERVVAGMGPGAHDALWDTVRAFDAGPWLPGIACPLLGIYGGRGMWGEDDAARLRCDLTLDRVRGTVSVAVVPAAGHFVGLECPEAVNWLMVDWLSALR